MLCSLSETAHYLEAGPGPTFTSGFGATQLVLRFLLVAVHFTKAGSQENRALPFYWLLAHSKPNVHILNTVMQKQYHKYKDGLFLNHKGQPKTT